MDAAGLAHRIGGTMREYLFDEWSSGLTSICGCFHPMRHDGSNRVMGTVSSANMGGVEIAHIANDLDRVERGQGDVRKDLGDFLFLLIQLDGECGVEQRDERAILRPGECVLVDSTAPSKFSFFGKFSNHISVHLPRQLIFSGSDVVPDIARRIRADDPMATMLRAIMAKLADCREQNHRAPQLRQLLFDIVRQAFMSDADEQARRPTSSSAAARLEFVQLLIDRYLTEESLSPRWLAERAGISLRTLQEDFNAMGTTVTSHIRTRRLHLAREQLRDLSDNGGRKRNISEVAYAAGFNDISYFNRCFKDLFNCSPKEVAMN